MHDSAEGTGETGGEKVIRSIAYGLLLTVLALSFGLLCGVGISQTTITPGETTFGPPSYTISTVPAGIPCDPAERSVPGCLPYDRQGWIVFVYGGHGPQFRVTFEWRDVNDSGWLLVGEDGKPKTHQRSFIIRKGQTCTYERIDDSLKCAEPSDGIAGGSIVFRVGRPLTKLWPVGTSAVKTTVEEGSFKPSAKTVQEYQQ